MRGEPWVGFTAKIHSLPVYNLLALTGLGRSYYCAIAYPWIESFGLSVAPETYFLHGNCLKRQSRPKRNAVILTTLIPR